MAPIAVVAAVSERYGVDQVMQFKRRVNQDQFKEFLLRLRNKYPFRRMTLVLDNLSAHKTKAVLKYMKEADIGVIFNVPYSPDYNSIELVFAQVKHRYKRLRLEAYSNHEDDDAAATVDEAWKWIKRESVVKCIKHTEDLIERDFNKKFQN